MKYHCRTAPLILALLMCAAIASPAWAQKKDAKAKGPGFKTSEIKAISKTLSEVRAQPRVAGTEKEFKKKQKALAAFTKAIESAKKSHKNEDILAFSEGWSEIFANVANENRGRGEGKGRVQKETAGIMSKGTFLGFNYALYVPSKYNKKQSFPLIIALHDAKGSKSDGASYLKEVWTDKKKIPKAVYDQFLILAPTFNEKTANKKGAVGKSGSKRVEEFSPLHRAGIALCLRDVLRNYNVDTTRMYVDGTGFGGKTATWLAMTQPRLFAAAASRSSKPFPELSLISNLKNQCPLWLVDRSDGPLHTGDGEKLRKAIEKLAGEQEAPLTMKAYPALPSDKERRLALRTQSVDPVHTSTPDIAKWFLEHSRSLAPSKLSYLSIDSRRLVQAAWFKLERADADPKAGTKAMVEGEVDRATNTLKFKTSNVETFRVFLNDQLVDMDKEVHVEVNGKKLLSEKPGRSLEYMLNYNRQNPFDPALVMTGELTVNVPIEEEKEGEEEGK